MNSSTRWTGVSIAMLTCARLPLPRSPLFVPPRPPRRCRDALEQRAVNGRPPASQQGPAGQHWPLGYPLPSPTAHVLAEHPPPGAGAVLRPNGATGAASQARHARVLGGIHAASASRIASSGAAQGGHSSQLPMAAAQLSSSPLIKQLVSQHSGQQSSKAYTAQHVYPNRADSAQNAVRCCSMPERVRSGHSQDLRLTGSQEHVLRPVTAQRQQQHPAQHPRASSAPAEQPRLPLRQVQLTDLSPLATHVCTRLPRLTNSPLRPPHGLRTDCSLCRCRSRGKT